MKEYIEREAALKVVCEKVYFNNILPGIKAIPAADVAEVRHGEFEGQVIHTIWPIRRCSECHEYVPHGNYCSNCGAKMDGGADDEI